VAAPERSHRGKESWRTGRVAAAPAPAPACGAGHEWRRVGRGGRTSVLPPAEGGRPTFGAHHQRPGPATGFPFAMRSRRADPSAGHDIASGVSSAAARARHRRLRTPR
jgi:hypothetical protein